MDDSTIFTIKDSIKNGPFISYIHLDSNEIKIAKGNLQNGLRQGETTFYYGTGELDCIEIFIDGKENGIYKEFYKNRRLEETGFRKEFSKEGDWFYYDSTGTLNRKIIYEHDRKKHEEEYYENGNIRLQGDYAQVFIKPKKELKSPRNPPPV